MRTGVCDSYNAAFVYFMRRIGIPAMTVNGYYVRKNGVKDTHSWAVVKLGNKYYSFDSEIDDWIQNQLKNPTYINHFCVEQIGNPRYELVDSDWKIVPKNAQQGYLDFLMSQVNINGYEGTQYNGGYIPMRSNTALLKGINTNPKAPVKKENNKKKVVKKYKKGVKKVNKASKYKVKKVYKKRR